MTDYPPSTPVRFEPSMEQFADDEAKTEAGLIETLDNISARSRAARGSCPIDEPRPAEGASKVAS
jgi:hypothetical protein